MKTAIEKFEEWNTPFTDEEWPHAYLRVVNDPRFAVYGLSRKDILDVTYHLKCWNKTVADLKRDIPR